MRLASHAQGTARPWHPGGQETCAPLDAAARHPGQDPAQICGDHGQPPQPRRVAPNLVQRRFNPDTPDQLWCGNTTYIATDEGWVYLAAVIDLFSRQVVGWSMQAHNY